MPITLTAPALAFPQLAQRFNLILDGLCRAVAIFMAKPKTVPQPAALPLLMLLWTRLRRAAARFESLVARAEAGQPLRSMREQPSRPLDHTSRDYLPRGIGWLIKQLPEANAYGSQLRHLLAEPEMAALLAASPQAGRILRPLCRMLAVPGPAPTTPHSKAASPPDPGAPDAATSSRPAVEPHRPSPPAQAPPVGGTILRASMPAATDGTPA